MTTDFGYNGKQIVSSGPFKPGGKDMPSDARTRVESYADIASIPNPHVGLKVTVKVDETNNNKMTDYIVKSLKANASGIANSVIDQVQRYVDYLGASSGGSVSQEDINTAVNNYLTEHPVTGGATAEQANQIQANKTAIGDENSGLIKGLNDIATLTIPGFTPPNEIYEFDEIDNTWMTSSDNKTLAITSDEFLADWYDIYLGVHDDGLNVTKNIIGKDQSGSYYVYEYDFKPKNYTRTILLTSGTHAYELSASFGLAYFFKDLMTTPYKHDGFKYIRENVRIKVIPIANPWGYNQSPKVYANSNGVNPNRNFNFNGSWDAYPVKVNEWDYKGTAPFSEQETKNFANWLYYNKEIADFWVECHTDYNNSSYDNYIVYQSYSPLADKVAKVLEKLSNRIKSKYSVTTVSNHEQVDHENNIIQKWSEKVIGIPMVTIEQSPLNPKWKTGDYNNNGGAIREYAVTIFAYLQEFLSCDSSSFNILDYLHKLRDDILNNSCKQIPYYSSHGYNMFENAGSTGGSSSGGSSSGGSTTEGGTLTCTKVALGVNGEETSSTTRVSTDYIPVTITGSSIKINYSGTYQYALRLYDSSKTCLGITPSSAFKNPKLGWGTGQETITDSSLTSNVAYVRLLFRADSTGTTEINTISGTLTVNDTAYNLTMSEDAGGTGGGSSSGGSDTGGSSTPEGNTLTCTNVGLDLDGTENPSTTRVSTDYIPVTISNTTLTVNYSGTYQYALRLYDSSKTCLGITPSSAFKNPKLGWGTGQETITDSSLTSNVAYVRLLFRADSTGTTEINTISGTLTVNDTTYNLTMSENAGDAGGGSSSGGSSTPEGNTLTCARVALDLDGTESPSTTRISTDYIPVTISNSTITIKHTGHQYALRLYDSSKNCLGYTKPTAFKDPTKGWGTNQETITDSSLTSNVAYIRILFRADDTGTTEINTISGTLTVNDTTYNLTM